MLFSFIFSYLESFFVVFCLFFLSYSGAGDLRARPLLTHVVEGVPTAPTRDTPRLAWGVIGGIAPGWTSATLRRTVDGWHGIGLPNKSRREFYGQWRLGKFALNDFGTPRSTGKSHNLKETIRG